jgi:hypothetical protein
MATGLALCAALMIWAGLPATAAAQQTALDTKRIEQLTGLKGKLNEQEGVYRITIPRTDVKVSASGWPMPPFMGLTSWAAFEPSGEPGRVLVTGDLVLFEDEVNPALSTALESGLMVSGLHNHMFYDQPRVYFMHLEREGYLGQLATGLRCVLERIKRVREMSPQPAMGFGGGPVPEGSSISSGPLEQIFGQKGESSEGMFKVVIGRRTQLPCCPIAKDMGVNTWAAFQGKNQDAVVDGDFAVREDELEPILKALRQAGINIVAIHNHFIHDDPRILFVHYWGRGPAEDLARGVKNALNRQGPE